MLFDNGRGPGFAVHGKLAHLLRAKRHSFKLNIILDAADGKDATMEQVRLCISPRQLLYRRMK